MKENPSDTTRGSIVKVCFHRPLNGKSDYYFGSLKAIYSMFSEDEIGCGIKGLYSGHITFDHDKVTKNCIISKHPILRVRSEN